MARGNFERLWQDFLSVDPADGKAVNAFIEERGLVFSYSDFIRIGANLRRFLVKPSVFRDLQQDFRRAVDVIGRGRINADYWEQLDYVNGILADNTALMPAVVGDRLKGYRYGVFAVEGSEVTSVGEIFHSFALALARNTVGVCPMCGKVFFLNERRKAARDQKHQNAYCSNACGRKFIESRPDRKRKKMLAMRRLRRRRRAREEA